MLIELERLKYEAIEKLVHEDVLAVRVRNFVTADVAANLSEKL